MNKTYLTIVYYTVVVLFTFLPLILLATFNCFLVAAVHNSTKLRRDMTHSRKVSPELSRRVCFSGIQWMLVDV